MGKQLGPAKLQHRVMLACAKQTSRCRTWCDAGPDLDKIIIAMSVPEPALSPLGFHFSLLVSALLFLSCKTIQKWTKWVETNACVWLVYTEILTKWADQFAAQLVFGRHDDAHNDICRIRSRDSPTICAWRGPARKEDLEADG